MITKYREVEPTCPKCGLHSFHRFATGTICEYVTTMRVWPTGVIGVDGALRDSYADQQHGWVYVCKSCEYRTTEEHELVLKGFDQDPGVSV